MSPDIATIDGEIESLRPRAAVERHLARLGRRAGRFAGSDELLAQAERRRAEIERELEERREAATFAQDLTGLIIAMEAKMDAERRCEFFRAEKEGLGVTAALKRRYELLGPTPGAPVNGAMLELDFAEKNGSAKFTQTEAKVLKRWLAIDGEIIAAGSAAEGASAQIAGILERHPGLHGVGVDELREMLV